MSLSVQLFTIPEVACDLLREGLLSSLLNAIKGTVQGLVEVKEGLKVVKSLPLGRGKSSGAVRSTGDFGHIWRLSAFQRPKGLTRSSFESLRDWPFSLEQATYAWIIMLYIIEMFWIFIIYRYYNCITTIDL